MKKIKICPKCGGEMYLKWSDHCVGTFDNIIENEHGEAIGINESNLTRGEGGNSNSPSSEIAYCNDCDFYTEDLEGLPSKTIGKESDLNLLRLPIRIYTILRIHEIKNISELLSISDEELRKMKNFGETSLQEVKTALKKYKEEK